MACCNGGRPAMANEHMAPDPMIRAMEVKYDRLFAGYAKSPTLRKIWRDAYGDDFPEKVEPPSYVTLTDLRRIVSALCVGPGGTLVDPRGGGGGPAPRGVRPTGGPGGRAGVAPTRVGPREKSR